MYASCPEAVAPPGMIKTWPIGVCSRSADISEWSPRRAFSPSPPACVPTATPPVKMAATTATAPAATATDAAIRFRRFWGQRHLARDSEVGGAVPVTSAGGVLVVAGVGSVAGSPVAVGVGPGVGSLVAAGVGSVASFEFGSGGVSLGPGVSVIPSSLPTDVMRRMCRSEVDPVNQAGGISRCLVTLGRALRRAVRRTRTDGDVGQRRPEMRVAQHDLCAPRAGEAMRRRAHQRRHGVARWLGLRR